MKKPFSFPFLFLMLLLAALLSVSVSAEEDAATDVYRGISYSRVYDYEYYTTQTTYGKRFAGSPKAAIAYFVKRGMKRQQQACESFDVKSYRYGCPALRRKFGTDYKSYYMQFQQKGYRKAKYRNAATGVTEMQDPVTMYGRIDLKKIYDYNYYVSRYPSVLKKVGDDDKAVLKYFVKKGLKKNQVGKDPERWPKADPSSKTYKNIKKKIKKNKVYDGTGLIVCIDPGHQAKGDYSHEQIAPGSGSTKPKVTSGAYGNWSHKNEYEINLDVSKKLRSELEARGYTVIMTRTKHNVHITNIERAKFANKAGADILIHIHANDIDGASSFSGVLCYAAASNNPWLKKKVIERGQKLAVLLRDNQAKATGQRRQDNIYENNMTGINWAKMPSVIVEMGFMSNPTEDMKMANSGFQRKIAKGLANGVDAYFYDLKD